MTRTNGNAVITGGSMGLGRALADELVRAGWSVTIDGRTASVLARAEEQLTRLAGPGQRVGAVAGDIGDADHRRRLLELATAAGPIDLLVNNASELGGSPLPGLRDLEATAYERVLHTNVVAPQQLVRAALDRLSPDAVIVNISSDAGVEHYPTWGGYGSAKAALDHQSMTWAAEEPGLTWYAVDPGDLRTAMHQAAFPGEDISDRPAPETVAPTLVALVGSGRPSGRYRAADLREAVAGAA